MILKTHQLDEAQLHKLRALLARCREKDSGTPTLYFHLLKQRRATESNVLYLEDNKLLGFLSVYFFYEDACEVSLLVAPKYRLRGIAKQLLKAILPLLEAREMKNLIFSSPSSTDKTWLQRLGFSYHHSEYHMERTSKEEIISSSSKLNIRKALLTDIPALCTIDEACFSDQHEDMITRLNMLMQDPNYTLFLALHQKEVVGKAHLHWQEKGAILSDVAILPAYQGQGWGAEMLCFCINHVLSTGCNKIMLDVETSNEGALRLYTRHGFKTTNASDYWQIPLKDLAFNWKI